MCVCVASFEFIDVCSQLLLASLTLVSGRLLTVRSQCNMCVSLFLVGAKKQKKIKFIKGRIWLLFCSPVIACRTSSEGFAFMVDSLVVSVLEKKKVC